MEYEDWQNIYDNLYADNNRLTKLYYDIYENDDISKKVAQKLKIEMQSLMTAIYYRITLNQDALKLFKYGFGNNDELKRNSQDLKQPSHADSILSEYLYDLKLYIENLRANT
ncbi:hypothetical protein AAEO56_16245 [Flavobacterium sp. DGU11]|uniref:Uncharacterized protein n=1 Tax=Flavobacterium arundinis TaxID=3139143 RepID=A0ABU9I071_9FLAO